MVSRALLCSDFLVGDLGVEASLDLADPNDLDDAVVDNPACAACHTHLDPLASFIPFLEDWSVAAMTYPMALFDDQPDHWEGLSGRPPSYFGTPGDDLADLGRSIAADPRFVTCTVRRFYSYLAQIPLDEVPASTIEQLEESFVASGLSAKALAVAVVLHPSMQISDPLRTRPDQLASVIEDLTGYRWETWTEDSCCAWPAVSSALGHTDLMRDDLVGYHALAGGVDGVTKRQPTHTTTGGAALVHRRLAELAAAAVIDDDSPTGALQIDPVDPDEAAIRDQLVALYWQLYGERTDPAGVEDAWVLWSAAYTNSASVPHAWRVTLAALLQDFDLAFY